jgi:cholinesterase
VIVIDANHFQAGGASVHLHMLSNHSKNLFKKAIAMSGCAFSSWAMAPPSNWAERLAKHLGWAGDSEANLLEFLEACDSFDMIKAQTQIFTEEESAGFHVLFSFAPVIEPFESENCFISKDLVLMAREAWSKDVDFIIGATSFEGIINAHIHQSELFEVHKKISDDNVGYFAPVRDLKIDANSEKSKEYGRKIKKLYFGEEEFTKENVEKYYRVSVVI